MKDKNYRICHCVNSNKYFCFKMKVKMIIVLTNCKCMIKICYKRVFFISF